MARQIQVTNLSDSIENLNLIQLFKVHGTIRTATISRLFQAERGDGMAFIEMESEENGAAAIAALNNQEHFGCVLSVRWSGTSQNQLLDPPQMFGPMNMPSDQTSKEGSD